MFQFIKAWVHSNFIHLDFCSKCIESVHIYSTLLCLCFYYDFAFFFLCFCVLNHEMKKLGIVNKVDSQIKCITFMVSLRLYAIVVSLRFQWPVEFIWVDFHYAKGGTWGVFLMFGHGKKMVQFYSSPKFGVGMSVWS
jgi:hypothetical protein